MGKPISLIYLIIFVGSVFLIFIIERDHNHVTSKDYISREGFMANFRSVNEFYKKLRSRYIQYFTRIKFKTKKGDISL